MGPDVIAAFDGTTASRKNNRIVEDACCLTYFVPDHCYEDSPSYVFLKRDLVLDRTLWLFE